MNWSTLFYFLGAALLVFLAIRIIRNNPEAFSKANFGKSLSTIGFLTLLLIVIVAFCVMLLRSTS